jgi:RNA polymerase sigma-70 factor (ECF subfamily)
MGAAARALLGFDPATALAPEAPIAVSQGLAPLPWSSRALSTDTAALVERCQVGDREALGELYRRFKGEAMRFIRHAVRDGRDADDILQEAFLEVASSIHSFKGRSPFESWLRCICVRTALRHMKRATRQIGEPDDDLEKKALREVAPSGDPGEGFERRERSRRVGRLLDRIAPKKRMVLLLHDFEGIAPKEISRLVGAPVLTVRTRLFYARKELAALAARDPMLSHDLRPWLDAKEKS